MLILGKISDIMGRKRIFTLGIAIFSLGLITCALARGISELIFYRCLQGLGAAMVISCGTALVTEAFPVTEIGRGMGLLGISVSLGFIIGPILGGVPAGLAGLALHLLCEGAHHPPLPVSEPLHAPKGRDPGLDLEAGLARGDCLLGRHSLPDLRGQPGE